MAYHGRPPPYRRPVFLRHQCRVHARVRFVDGVVQTPTSSTPASSQYYLPFRRLVAGGYRGSYSSHFDQTSSSFPGRISDIAICGQLHSDAVMARSSNLALPKGAARFAPGILHYWPCDEVTDGQTGIQEIYTYPSADVNTLWTNKSLATYWESVRHDDTNRIEATETDSDEEQQIAFANAAFIKPAGTEVIAIGVNMKSDAPSGQMMFTTSIKKGATWWPMPYANSGFTAWFTDGKRKEVMFTREMGWGDWTQSELNSLQVGLLTGTMDKDDFVTVNYMYVTAYCGVWTDQFRDYVGGNHLLNRNAIGRAERFANYL